MNSSSLDAVITAAHNLASRYDERTRCIRSWNVAYSKVYSIVGQEEDFLVIIDSMCNLDLLYWVASFTGDTSLSDKATSHARVVRETLIREDYSTCHCVNLNPATGDVKYRFTHQGSSESSCWTRGQAWAILGFVQTYNWTNDIVFLKTAMSLADYFCQRLQRAVYEAPYVPPWDFDALIVAGESVLRDTSAGMIAANGLILLHQTLQGHSSYQEATMRIIQDTLEYSLAPDQPHFEVLEGKLVVSGMEFPAILKHSTANNNENARIRYSDHGLIYADYFFLEL